MVLYHRLSKAITLLLELCLPPSLSHSVFFFCFHSPVFAMPVGLCVRPVISTQPVDRSVTLGVCVYVCVRVLSRKCSDTFSHVCSITALSFFFLLSQCLGAALFIPNLHTCTRRKLPKIPNPEERACVSIIIHPLKKIGYLLLMKPLRFTSSMIYSHYLRLLFCYGLVLLHKQIFNRSQEIKQPAPENTQPY